MAITGSFGFEIGTDEKGRTFDLPMDTITRSTAILGIKGSGKTWAAGVVEEEMAEHNVPFLVMDIMGAHIGIKERYPVVVFGGLQADVPISPDIGPEIVEAVLAENMSVIVDISQFARSEQRSFAAAFFEALYARNTTPRHVFIEEVQELAPQTVTPGARASYEAIDVLVRLGRQKGLGTTLIGQRAALINKDILSQCGTFFMLRTTYNNDMQVFRELIRGNVPDAAFDEFMSSIRGLTTGTAWVWSPHDLLVFQRVQIRARRTFHAGATPQFGEDLQFTPVKVDASGLAARFEELVATRAQAHDELSRARSRIAQLEEQVEGLQRRASLREEIVALLRDDGQGASATAMEGVTQRIEEIETELGQAHDDLTRAREETEAMARRAEDAQVELALAQTDRQSVMDGARLLFQALRQLGIQAGEVTPKSAPGPMDLDQVVEQVLARMPAGTRPQVVMPPVAALRADYLEREVQRILSDIKALSGLQRDMLLWLVQYGDFTTQRNLLLRVTGSAPTGGSGYRPFEQDFSALVSAGLVTKDNKRGLKAAIIERVKRDLADYAPSDEETEAVTARVLAELYQERNK